MKPEPIRDDQPSPPRSGAIALTDANSSPIGSASADATSASSRRAKLREVDLDTLKVAASVRKLGAGEERLYTDMLKRLKAQPQFGSDVLSALMSYRQARHMFDVGQMFEPHPGATGVDETTRPIEVKGNA